MGQGNSCPQNSFPAGSDALPLASSLAHKAQWSTPDLFVPVALPQLPVCSESQTFLSVLCSPNSRGHMSDHLSDPRRPSLPNMVWGPSSVLHSILAFQQFSLKDFFSLSKLSCPLSSVLSHSFYILDLYGELRVTILVSEISLANPLPVD